MILRRLIVIFVISLILLLGAVPARAIQVLNISAQQLVDTADVAFRGVCQDRKVEKLENKMFPQGLIVTRYTFSVSETLKGNVPAVFQFAQLGAPRQEMNAFREPFNIRAPVYEVGKEYVLFLVAESSLGLRSPIGWAQGKFGVSESLAGKVVHNPFFKTLFKALPVNRPEVGRAVKSANINVANPAGEPMGYDSFKTLIKSLQKP